MSIATVYNKSKQYAILCKHILLTSPSRIPKDVVIIVLFIMTTLAGFGLGFITGKNSIYSNNSIRIEQPSINSNISTSNKKDAKKVLNAQVIQHTVFQKTNETIVASKNGKKYYLISCNGAKRIHKENKVWFTSAKIARKKGYTPAQRCFGI